MAVAPAAASDAGERAQRQEFGDLRGVELALARAQRAQDGGVVTALVLRHGDRGLEHQHAAQQREQEHELDCARDLSMIDCTCCMISPTSITSTFGNWRSSGVSHAGLPLAARTAAM